MPLPNTSDASSMFVGSNITEFLERYQDVAEDCGLIKKDMVKCLPKYCEYTVTRPYIEFIKEWEDKDWDALCKTLKKEYKEEDYAQNLRTVAYLRTQFRDKKWKNENDINKYCRQYRSISGLLMRRGKLSKEQKT